MTTTTKRGKILYVEDDQSVRWGLARVLTMADWDVIACDSAETALDHYAATAFQGYDAILTDYDLGAGQTGYALVAQLRQRGCRLPVVLLTGDCPGEAVQRAFDAVLTKPATWGEITMTLDGVILRGTRRPSHEHGLCD